MPRAEYPACERCGEPIATERGRPPRTPQRYCRSHRPRSGKHTTCGYCEKHTTGERFCNAICAELAAWERRRPPIQIRDCKWCGEAFAIITASHPEYCCPEHKLKGRVTQAKARNSTEEARARNASPERREWYRAWNRERTRKQRLLAWAEKLAAWAPVAFPPMLPPAPNATQCPGCGQWHASRRRQYCSPECSREAKVRLDRAKSRRTAEIRAASRVWTVGPCRECGKHFATTRTQGAFCSTTCAKRNARRRDKASRTKRIQAGVRREVIDLAVLAKRDGWRCHICKHKVSRKTWSHDHLVPLSHGGSHTWDNVALAHHVCNTKRGAHGAAQLLLHS